MSNFKFQIVNKGFTLIELLVVFSLIGVVISVALPAFGASRKNARDGKRKADLEMTRSALEMYRSDKGTYPLKADGGLDLLVSNGYLGSKPVDPINSTTFVYDYECTVANSYLLGATLENGGQATNCSGSCSCGGVACNYVTCNP